MARALLGTLWVLTAAACSYDFKISPSCSHTHPCQADKICIHGMCQAMSSDPPAQAPQADLPAQAPQAEVETHPLPPDTFSSSDAFQTETSPDPSQAAAMPEFSLNSADNPICLPEAGSGFLKSGGIPCQHALECQSGVCCGQRCTYGWMRMESGVPSHLNALSGVDPHHMIAVGQQGVVLHYEDQSWKSRFLKTDSEVQWTAAFMRTPWEALIGGQQGEVARFDGTSWHVLASPTKDPIRSIYLVGPQEGYVLTHVNMFYFKGYTHTWKPLNIFPKESYSMHLHAVGKTLHAVAWTPASVGYHASLQEGRWDLHKMANFNPMHMASYQGVPIVEGVDGNYQSQLKLLYNETTPETTPKTTPTLDFHTLPVEVWSVWGMQETLLTLVSLHADQRMILRYAADTGQWISEHTPQQWYTSLWGSGACDVYAIGAYGAIARR